MSVGNPREHFSSLKKKIGITFCVFQSWELQFSGFVCLVLKRPFPVPFGLEPALGMTIRLIYQKLPETEAYIPKYRLSFIKWIPPPGGGEGFAGIWYISPFSGGDMVYKDFGCGFWELTYGRLRSSAAPTDSVSDRV